MAHVLNEETVEKKLLSVTNTQDSIQSLSLWIIHHRSNHAKIVELWMKVLKKSVKPSHRLTMLYLCNDVVQNCKKKKAFVYNSAFKEYLREAASLVRDQSVKNKVERIFNIWGERGVYDTAFVKSLHSILNGQHVKSYRLNENVKTAAASVSEVNTASHSVHSEPKATPMEQVEQTEQNAEESARILADFKPHEMIDQITAFLRQENDIKFRASQLNNLKLDVSSLEAMKHLKDRTHGNNFSYHFEESVMKLEDLIKRQSYHMENQRTLLLTLTLSETFYEEQYREAKIVANAYRNFGARINNIKKKLDELKRSMPEPELDSPIPSPDINALSAGNTPPDLSRSSFTYNPATPMEYGQGLQSKTWMYNETGSIFGTPAMNSNTQDSNSFPSSPFEEAPSPEDSPTNESLYGSDNANESLESRLASFLGRRRSGTSDTSVNISQLPQSLGSSSKSKLVDDEGNRTPLDDDETPTTPVQDEHLASPPKRNTPPKKENPIDFLSRLISQTQKAPVKTETQTFLDSLTMMTMVNNKPDTDSQQQKTVTTPPVWAAWNSKPSEITMSPTQPSSPSTFGPSSNVPTSPKQFPPILTMAPPPIPMPIPPPIPMTMPPPPPPFVLMQALHPNFSTPPPNFQKTSPGPKENNWPEVQHSELGNPTSSLHLTQSSILKELVPIDKAAEPIRQLDDRMGMELVSSDEENADENSDIDETSVESQVEFSQKLNQKSSQSALKSHVFVPNPERPNLMTLTVTDDLDEEDMIDDDTVTEKPPVWTDTSNKPSQRSRSQSKEKDTSYNLKETEKWNSSDDDNSRQSVNSNTCATNGDSIVQKIETNTNKNFLDGNDKRKNYWESIDKKYEQYQRGNGGWGNNRSFENFRGAKDPVQAYTQAYREAFFQQYNQARFNNFTRAPPPMNPRWSGQGKYYP